MKKFTFVCVALALCLSATAAMANDRPEMYINLAGGAVSYYKDAMGSAQVGMELVVPIWREFHLAGEAGGSFFSIPLLNSRFTAGPQFETSRGYAIDFRALCEITQGVDRERPQTVFLGASNSLMIPLNSENYRFGMVVDYAANLNNGPYLFFIGLKLSMPIGLSETGATDYRVKRPFEKY